MSELNDRVTALVSDGMNRVSDSALEAAIITLVKVSTANIEAKVKELESEMNNRKENNI